MGQLFKFGNYIHNQETPGIAVTNFLSSRLMTTMKLSPGGYRLLTVPNAGGSSVVSEVLSFELLNRCFNAKLTKTEMEVSYFPHGGSITDYVCEVFQTTVGVSVTRAMKYGTEEYTQEDAERLLNKKLRGVIQSTRNSLEPWAKQILHVWSFSDHITRVLTKTYEECVTEDIKANTVVLITTANNANYIFNNG